MKKKTEKKEKLDVQVSLGERFLNSNFARFVYMNKKAITVSFFVFIAVLSLLVWFLERQEGKTSKEIIEAKQLVQKLVLEEVHPSQVSEKEKNYIQLFAELSQIADKNDTVKKQVKGVLAQESLLTGDSKKTEQLLRLCEKELIARDLPLYAAFEESQALAQENRPREALQGLQKILNDEAIGKYPVLKAYAYLYEIALLDSLQKIKEKEEAIGSLRMFLDGKDPNFPEETKNLFRDTIEFDSYSLLDFLAKR